MKSPTTRLALAATACAAVLLAGCSAGEPEVAASTEPTTLALADDAGGLEGGSFQPSGLTGEVVYLSDAVAQVQDGSSQSAVTYTEATVFTQQVEVALTDVQVGDCALVTLDDEGSAATVTLTDPEEDGTCAVGLGGGFGGAGGGAFPGGDDAGADAPGGELPSGDPTAMPGGGEMPTDMPTAMPGGDFDAGDAPADAGDFALTSMSAGEVVAVGDGTLTIEDAEGEQTVFTVADDAEITGTVEADESAVEVGQCVTVTGEPDDSGAYDATAITVFAPGDDGCVAVTAVAGRGAMPGGFGDTDESDE